MLKVILIAFVAFAQAQDELNQDFQINYDLGSPADLNFANYAAFTGLDLGFSSPQELQQYQANFDANSAIINTFNAAPNSTFTLGYNSFSHLSGEQFGATRFGFQYTPEFRSLPKAPAAPAFNSYTKANVPASLNLQSKMRPVQNQGLCGSCWAFATMAMLGKKV